VKNTTRPIDVATARCNNTSGDTAKSIHDRLCLRAGAEDQIDNHICLRAHCNQFASVAKYMFGWQIDFRLSTMKYRNGVTHF